MHLLLTDLLTCPRCGPDFGLIVLSDEIRDRRVRAGSVGCANCRSSFPIFEGTVDLRTAGSPPLVPTSGPGMSGDEERPLRVAALLGVRGANSTVLILEASHEVATAVAELIPDVHVVAGNPGITETASGDDRIVSRLLTGHRLPVRSASLKGVAVLGLEVSELLREIRRVLLPGARLVVEPAPDTLASKLEEEGFVVHLEQGGVVVAGTPERG